MTKRALLVTTVSRFVPQFEMNNVKLLQESGYEIHYAANYNNDLYGGYNERLKGTGIIQHQIDFARSPFSKQTAIAYRQLKQLLRDMRFDIVHCHTPNAAAITRLACRKLRRDGLKVLYTAHGFHFYKGAPRKNWLLYYPVEWLCAHWTDVLITINREDYALAQRKMKAQKVCYVPGVGVDLSKFQPAHIDRMEKRRELGVPGTASLILSVGELNENKNHETLIRAIADMDVYCVIAGQGERQGYLQTLIQSLGLERRVKLLGFRSDISELCAAADLFAFPSYREGLGLAAAEAMACELPVACSKIRGPADLVDEKGGALFDPHSVQSCKGAIEAVLEGDWAVMGSHNREKVKAFSTENVQRAMKEIYSQL